MQGKRTVSDIIRNISGGATSAHAYIVEGRPGVGRDTFISELAMGLECLDPDVGARPCGHCSACRQVAAGTSLDIVRMQMSGKTGYKTEDANAFAERLDMGAYGRFLIGIIDDADSLSETVQNKLLKTLEEPRGNVILLLGTGNRDHLLSTVRSRCSMVTVPGDDGASEDESAKTEALKAAAEMLLSGGYAGGGYGSRAGRSDDIAAGGAAFCEFRDAVEKSVKARADALSLISLAEDIARERMLSADDAAAMADTLELCERARADIEQGMDRSRALKRLFLELTK